MRVFAATVFLGLSTCAAFNYAVDPSHHMRKQTVAIPAAWTGEQVLVFPAGVNDRALRKSSIPLIAAPDLVLLGSSRMMNVSKSVFASNIRLFNAGLTAASVEDYAALWQVLKENKKIPRYLIIYADPWILNKNSDLISWHTIAEDYQRFMRQAAGIPVSPAEFSARCAWQRLLGGYSKFKEMINWYMLGTSLAKWRSASSGLSPFLITEGAHLSGLAVGWRTDGSSYLLETQPALEEVRGHAQRFVAGPTYLTKFKIDPLAVATLSALTNEAANAGVKVLLIGLPYHKVVMDRIESRAGYAGVIALYLKTLNTMPGSSRDIEVCESVDPSQAGCTETEFVDGMHPLLTCHAKVLKQCLAGRPAWHKLLD